MVYFLSVTISLVHKPKQRKPNKSRAPALESCPQKRAIVIRSFETTPRKPNSARRKVAKVRLSNKRRLNVYLEGIGTNKLQPHSVILVRGKGPRDVPGVRYHAIRGVKDFPRLYDRKTSRSLYGTPRPKLTSQEKMERFLRTYKQKRRFLMYNIHSNLFWRIRFHY